MVGPFHYLFGGGGTAASFFRHLNISLKSQSSTEIVLAMFNVALLTNLSGRMLEDRPARQQLA